MTHMPSTGRHETEHLSDERLAALASESAEGALLDSEQQHLFGCERCLSAVAELAHARKTFEEQPHAVTVPRDWIHEALRIPQGTESARDGLGSRRQTRRVWRRWATGLAGAASFALLGVLLFPLLPDGTPDQNDRALLIDWSAQPMANYGYAITLSTQASVTRSANGVDAAALEELKILYREAPEPELAVQLVAMALAEGHFEDGRLYAIHAMQRFPEDSRLWVLRASVHRTEREPDAAESLLRRAFEADPQDMIAGYNLGILLLERGEPEGASILAEIARQDSDRPEVLHARTLIYGGN